MPDAYIYSVSSSFAGERIDKVICALNTEMTRSGVQKLIEKNAVSVNGSPVTKNYKVRSDDKISLIIPKATELNVCA